MSEADRLVVSALLPTIEELADAALEVATDLLPGEAMDAGDLARVMMTEALEEGAENVPEYGDEYAENAAPRPFHELLDDLVRVCLAAALRRLGHSSHEDAEGG